MKSFKKFVGLVFSLILLTGCGLGTAPKGRKPSADWSRGVPLGTTVAGTVGMVVEGDASRMHFAWPEVVGDDLAIHYVQLDKTAVPLVDKTLDLPVGRARTPRLWLSDEGMVLIWARRPSGSGSWELWQAVLDENGDVQETIQLSTAVMNVSSYELVGGYVVWEDAKTDSIYGLQVGQADPVQLVTQGENPSIQVDKTGVLHMSWRDGLKAYYAAFDDGMKTANGIIITELELQPTDSLGGPILAITDDYGILVWSRYISTGLESDTGRTDYVSFSLHNPTISSSHPLVVMPIEEQPYQPYAGGYSLSEMVQAPASPVMGGSYTIAPNAAAPRGNEVAVVVAAQQNSRLNSFIQMAVAIFKDGEFVGYQIAAKTEGFSREGVLATDGAGNLHLVWREGGSGRSLYYATTNAQTAAALDSISGTDVVEAAFTGAIEGMTGIAFFPLAMLWLLPGGILLGIRQLRREDDEPRQWGARVLLLISLVLYQITKALVLPSFLSYVPFSAWLEVSSGWQLPLRIGYPVFAMMMGLLTAEWVLRRRPSTATLTYFFIVACIDAIFTLSVYGVAFLGNF